MKFNSCPDCDEALVIFGDIAHCIDGRCCGFSINERTGKTPTDKEEIDNYKLYN